MAKIAAVNVENFLGLSAVKIEPNKPIVVIGGDNGAGKTSLYQAIRLALFDELPRVDLKKESGALVRGGAAKGFVRVNFEGETSTVTVPALARDGPVLNGALRLCLDPTAFPAMEPAERARTVLRLSGVKMTPDVVGARLKARSIPDAIIDELVPLMVLGFEKCAEHAKEQAAQKRGVWKHLTGETYGEVKAASWKPPEAGKLPDAPIDHAGAVQRHADATAKLAAAEAARSVNLEHLASVERDKALAPKVAELEDAVRRLTPFETADEEVPHFPCPECGTLLTPDYLGIARYVPTEKPPVTKAAKARGLATLTTAKRDLASAKAAAARLASPPELPTNPTDAELIDAKELVAANLDLLGSLSRQQEAYSAAVLARDSVERVQTSALAAHLGVKAWLAAHEAMSPAGIPSELMAEAMTPMRTAIKWVCASASVVDWPLPELSDDGELTAWGRPLALLSESELWRVGVLMAAALAYHMRYGIIAMDRADLLSPAHRAKLMGWLADMVDDAVLEQAWVFVTLKAPMTIPADFPAEAHWL